MDPLLKKLQYRPSTVITVLGAPAELAPTIDAWSAEGAVGTRLAKGAEFLIAFVRTSAELDRTIGRVVPKLADTAVLWFAYPKKSSTRYPSSDLGRDDSWQALGDLGFEPVRQVAVDADWSRCGSVEPSRSARWRGIRAGRCRGQAGHGPRAAPPPSTSSSPVPVRVVRR